MSSQTLNDLRNTDFLKQRLAAVKAYTSGPRNQERFEAYQSTTRDLNRRYHTSDIVRDLGAYNTPPARVNGAIDIVERNPISQTVEIGADVVGGLSGIAASASLLAPALLPVAAAGGIGFGLYKLGQTLKIW